MGTERRIFNTPSGVVPANYVKVSRWIGDNEIALWKRVNSHIPNEIGRGTQIYVTLFGAPKPGGVGSYRVDFFVPKAMLSNTANPLHKQIFGSVSNTPIYNVEVFDCR